MPDLQIALGLLAGDLGAIEKAVETCGGGWKKMMVACVCYNGDSVVAAAGEALARFPVGDITLADGALMEAALGGVDKALRRLAAGGVSYWFGAHLADLLVRQGGEDVDESLNDLREYFMKEYARELEGVRGCWRICADYYLQCKHGGGLMVEMLRRMPLGGGERAVEKVLLICRTRRLVKTAREICERLGNSCVSVGNWGGGMMWFLRAGLHGKCDEVVNQVLSRAEKEGVNSEGATALAYVSVCIGQFADGRLGERYEYVREYHEMQEALSHLSNGELTVEWGGMFGNAVRSLLSSGGDGGLPRKYWAVLCYETARLIEQLPEVARVLGRGGVQQVLGALEIGGLGGLVSRLKREGNNGGVKFIAEHCRGVMVGSVARLINEG